MTVQNQSRLNDVQVMPNLSEQLDQCWTHLSKCRQGFEKLQPDEQKDEEKAFAALCDLYAARLILEHAVQIFAGEPAVPFTSFSVLKRKTNQDRLRVLVKAFLEGGEKQGFSPRQIEELRLGMEEVASGDAVRAFHKFRDLRLIQDVEDQPKPKLVRDRLYIPTQSAIELCLVNSSI